MGGSYDGADLRGLIAETRDIWNRKAAYWDEYMKEGNDWHLNLISPAVERLLEVQPGQAILDIACGNGMLARRLAQLGARVTACDFSSEFISRARARSHGFADQIEYLVVDATDRDQLLGLREQRFDGATCTQGMMDMPVIAPLFEAAGRLVRPGGPFVVTLSHPCFNRTGMSIVAETVDDDAGRHTVTGVKVRNYLTMHPEKGGGVPGEPEPHYYFDRSLSELLAPAFRAGLVLDGIEEPSFERGAQDSGRLSWLSIPDIPPILALRFRVLA